MKKQLAYAFIFLFLTSNLLEAQVRFGARGSASITNITVAHSISKSRTGFQIAALGLIPIDNNDQFFFQPEINYSAQGEFNVHPHPDGDIDQKTFLSFINIPLNMKAYLSEAESEFFAEFGPYIGFKIGENIEKFDFPTEPDDEEYSSFDFGLGIGFGYSFNREFEVSVRYSYGFVDQVKRDAADDKNHNSVLNFGVSYIFW